MAVAWSGMSGGPAGKVAAANNATAPTSAIPAAGTPTTETRRKIKHPAVMAISEAAHRKLFA